MDSEIHAYSSVGLMAGIWHIAFAVPDLEQGMKEFGTAFGLGWRPVH